MINEFVNGYNSLKTNIVNKLGNNFEGLNDELDFLDDAIVQSKIRYIQKICKDIDNEIKYANDDSEKLAFLIKKKSEFINELIFLASNGIKNIDFCLSIIDENNSFKKCLNALKYYESGDKNRARSIFNEYFHENKYLIEHYLVSVVYGELLFEAGDYYNASLFLRKAVEKRPQSLEVHIMLKKLYIELNDEIMIEQENEIIDILAGD